MLSFHCPGMTHITNLTRMPRGAVPCESGYWKFEKWKVKWKSGSLISRSEKWNENLVHSFREWKVKWKCLDIEIESEKWNENVSKSRSRVKSELKMPRDRDREVKFLENFREILENQEIKKIFIFCYKCFSFSKLLLWNTTISISLTRLVFKKRIAIMILLYFCVIHGQNFWIFHDKKCIFHSFFREKRVKSEMLSLFPRNEKWIFFFFHSFRE